MNDQKKIVLAMLVISIFVLIVALSSFYVQIQIETGNICGCVIPIYLFIPLLASIGLFIGTMFYYLLSPKFEKIEKDVILNLFDSDEKIIVETLIKNHGKATQAKITKSTGLSKVKVHRVLERLENKNVISKKKERKVNIITLNKDLLRIF
ncbi:MAG: winged helix-turn-helix transcriptional regulator [Candidatus Aenigmarchaeota archaeon]|nr:winged helix-turn-helix transcriptional regulator [Candidatus Aenigmarchaeota archaeon]